ncbi:Imm26 family immunity protein [Fusobacterium sp.]|uniref:Imm26 family immunity protein n=1 Tax=Fusobacterium sp. TaxID=68766 RepID=UPI002A82263E|nr:Imm26 family immunity protein [Fusobacterium sp.]
MGRPLIIKIYHKISDNINVDLKDLSNCLALPSQAIMDNIFYYREAIILGNLPLEDKDYDIYFS